MTGPQFQDPRFVKARRLLDEAVHCQRLGQIEEADRLFTRLLKKNPEYFDALHVYGLFNYHQGKLAKAIGLLKKAVKINPGSVNASNNLGVAVCQDKRPQEALEVFDRALALDPGNAQTLNNRGNALFELNRLDDALTSFKKSLDIQPGFLQAHINCGRVLLTLDKCSEALDHYNRVLGIEPMNADVHKDRGAALLRLKRYDEAYSAFDKALALKPDLVDVAGARLFAKMFMCDWTNFDAECTQLISSVRNGAPAIMPFPFLAIPSSLADQLQCARLFGALRYPPSGKPAGSNDRYAHDRIRVAYVSGDFYDHPVSYQMAGVFEQHDRNRFETIAISFGPNNPGEMLARLRNAFDRFIDVRDQSDADIARLVKSLEIDIAVDLMGYTEGSRTGIFANRPAPIQASYLGYAGTMGVNYMDYLIADPVLIPESERTHYAEKIAYLPDCYMPHDSKRGLPDRVVDRVGMGLPPTGFVFCCFNNSYKLNPKILDRWTAILRAVDQSVLWLSDTNATAVANLKKQVAIRGVNPERLFFAKRMPSISDHLARHRVADLFLDTSPYNAHATACDALWAGLPLLSRIGESFAGRVAASLLRAAGMPELITQTDGDYERLAIQLAADPAKLAAIKYKLAANRPTAPLFNTRVFTQHIERIYEAMDARHQAGMRPDHIQIPA